MSVRVLDVTWFSAREYWLVVLHAGDVEVCVGDRAVAEDDGAAWRVASVSTRSVEMAEKGREMVFLDPLVGRDRPDEGEMLEIEAVEEDPSE